MFFCRVAPLQPKLARPPPARARGPLKIAWFLKLDAPCRARFLVGICCHSPQGPFYPRPRGFFIPVPRYPPPDEGSFFSAWVATDASLSEEEVMVKIPCLRLKAARKP